MNKLYNSGGSGCQNKNNLKTVLNGNLSRLTLLLLLSIFLFGKAGAQVYVNGNLSTGATSLSGTAAPAGFTWSEVQTGNTVTGFAASVTSTLRVTDDFTVPVGTSWQLSKMTFYGYQTNYAGATSPFTTLRLQIHQGTFDGPIVFGDLTTNRFASSVSAGIYRIVNTITTPTGTNTARQVWAIDATVNISLPAGTYWAEWQTDVTGSVAHFLPPSTVAGQVSAAGSNARNFNGTGYNRLIDGTANAVEMPFSVTYTTTTNCTGTPNPGNTLTTISPACSGRTFMLYTQNLSSGTGLLFQWQSAPAVGGPWTDIAGANLSRCHSHNR